MTTYPSAEPDVVTSLLAAIGSGHGLPAGLWAVDARLDATVPHWRFRRDGRGAIARELSGWYEVPITVEHVVRRPVPGGEAVEVELCWVEDAVPHSAHQLHLLSVQDNQIHAHSVFCGGRWPASLLAEMEAEDRRAKEADDDR